MKPNPTLTSVLENGALVLDATTCEGKWMSCPRKFYHYKVRKREAAKFYAGREFGKAIHVALDALRLGGDYLSALDSAFPIDMPMEDHRGLDYARQLVKKYADEFASESYATVFHNSKPMLEMGFAHPIGSVTLDSLTIPVIWEGKIDRVVRDQTGRLFVLDYKTSIIAGETWWQTFKRSTQQEGYAFVVSAILNEPVHGFIIDGLFTRKPTKTGKGMEVERRIFPLELDDLKRWQTNTLNVCSDLLRACATEQFNEHTSQCMTKFGPCEYLQVCSLSSEAMRNALLRSDEYQNVTWRPTE